MSICLTSVEDVIPTPGLPKIKEVRAFVSRATEYGASDMHDTADTHWIQGLPAADGSWDHKKTHPPITNPMSRYPKYSGSRSSWGVANVPSVIVEIEDENGLVGIGTSTGGEAAAFIIENHLALFVEGQNVRERAYLWEQMWRASIHYSRKGLAVHAISAVDIALWDLYGKTLNEPVYNLMGGRTKQRIPVYATGSRPDFAKEMGFHGAKVPLPYGPSAGEKGLSQNVAFIKDWREKVGPDFPLMLDCYMALDVEYAAKLAQRLEPYHLKWIEEPLMPDEYAGHAKLAKKLAGQGCSAYFATGEHEYTRFGYEQIIEKGAMDIIQPDLRRCGGLSEGRRICSLALAAGVTVIPHAYGPTHIHFALAETAIPMIEYFPLPCWDAMPDAEVEPIFHDEPQPVNGRVNAPDKPGLGVTVNENIFND